MLSLEVSVLNQKVIYRLFPFCDHLSCQQWVNRTIQDKPSAQRSQLAWNLREMLQINLFLKAGVEDRMRTGYW